MRQRAAGDGLRGRGKAPSPPHRNLIHASLLTALSVHKRREVGGKQPRGHRVLFLKGEQKKSSSGGKWGFAIK